MVNDVTPPSQVAMNLANGEQPTPSSAPAVDNNDVENTSATEVAAEKPALPPPASSGEKNADPISGSKDPETPASQPLPETGEVVVDGALNEFNQLYGDLDKIQQTVPAQADKPIVEVNTDTTDPLAPQQEQQHAPSVMEYNSFAQILEKTVCAKIQEDYLDKNKVCTPNAASDILCAALRADGGVGEAYQKSIANKVLAAKEHTLLFRENEVHAHLFTKGSWRPFFNMSSGTGAPPLTLVDTIKDVKRRLKTFYDESEATRRVKALRLPEGTEALYESVAPGDYFSGAGKAASLDHTHAYLNVRGDSANSVSIPIQEFADLIGYRNLLQSLACSGLTVDGVQQAQIALGLNALVNQGALDAKNGSYA